MRPCEKSLESGALYIALSCSRGYRPTSFPERSVKAGELLDSVAPRWYASESFPMLSAELSKVIDDTIDHERSALARLSHDIHANPELRFEEHKASTWIAELLRARGFE